VWRGIHLTSFGLYVMASLHTVLAGHDAHSIVFRVIALTLVQGVMFLTLVRLIAGRASWPVERRARERRAGERAWTPEERVADRARALATRPQEETAPTSGRSV
jgi:hypothetical protein